MLKGLAIPSRGRVSEKNVTDAMDADAASVKLLKLIYIYIFFCNVQ